MLGRLYTFGCSFTSYNWPTWADILLSLYPGENWGQGGAGNKFVLESLIECHVTNRIQPEDTIIIMLSSFAREDRYLDGGWKLFGNVYNSKPLYDEYFLNKYWSDKGAFLHNLNYISGCIEILKSLKCKWLMGYAFPMHRFADNADNTIQLVDNIESFQKYFTFIDEHKENIIEEPLFRDSYPGSSWKLAGWGKNIIDGHPTPATHYEWLEKNVLDRLELSSELREKIATFANEQIKIWTEKEKIGIHPTYTKEFYDKNHPKNKRI